MENIKEKFGGGKPTYQQEQAKLRSEEREKEDRKLRRKKIIKERKTRQRQQFNETLAKLPVKVKEVHLEGITGTKDILVKNILSDVLKVQNILLLTFFKYHDTMKFAPAQGKQHLNKMIFSGKYLW